MTKQEFEILDELYFLISYPDLVERVEMPEENLREELGKMVQKEWVRCFRKVDEDVDWVDVDFENQFANYHYLASKAGLLAHNST